MALFDRQRSRQRRVDPKKVRGDGPVSRLQTLMGQPGNLLRAAVAVILFGGAIVLCNAPQDPLPYREGDVASENIFPKVAFKYVDVEATERARQEARQKTPNVYARDHTQTQQLSEEFLGILAAAIEAVKPPPPPPVEPEPAVTEPPTGAETDPAPAPPAEAAPPGAEPASTETGSARTDDETAPEVEPKDPAEVWKLGDDFEQFKAAARDPKKLDELRKAFQAVVVHVDTLLLLTAKRHYLERGDQPRQQIFIYSEVEGRPEYERRDTASILSATDTADRETFRAGLAEVVNKAFAGTGIGLSVQRKIVDRFTETLSPNLRFEPRLTAEKKEEAARRVEEKVLEYGRHTLLVPAGVAIGPAGFSLLKAAHEAYLRQITWLGRAASITGSAVLLGLLTLLLIACTALYQPNVIERVVRAFILAGLFLVVMVIAKFFYAHLQRSMLIFPITTAAMIITIAYNRRFAVVATWALILLVTLITRLEEYDVVVLLVIGTGVAILQLGEVRSRSKLIRVGFVTGLVYFVTVWAQDMMFTREVAWSTLERAGLALLAGLLPGFIILGVLPIIERVFGVVTSISLLELCDANQPALRKLAIEAPGTYSHSLLLGSLVEPACEAIGADGLLARVGAYFHDIGKVNKPRYFAENTGQLPEPADHNKLTPQMSKLIITSHIKDGLDMARQFGLPRAVNAFIAEHHGTTVVSYFYHEAQKAGESPIDDTEFRYSGPKPQSEETAVLMLADSCEGAVRSIREPTAPKIEDKVHDVVMKRLLDGQLDESGLTLQDVRTIEQSLTKSLISVYHGRVSYPESPESNGPQPGASAGAQQPPGGAPQITRPKEQSEPDA